MIEGQLATLLEPLEPCLPRRTRTASVAVLRAKHSDLAQKWLAAPAGLTVNC